jgi:AraC-like DNA-binding protein
VSLRTLLIIGLLFVLVASGCYDPGDGRMYPYQLTKTAKLEGSISPADFDYDGDEELILRHRLSDTSQKEIWQIASSSGSIIDEITIAGNVRSWPTILNIDDEEGAREMLFGVNRNDSLFMHAYRPDASIAREPIFIANGKTRIDKNGNKFPWEAEVHFMKFDVDDDSVDELVSIVNSTHAGLPRGIYVHDLATGDKLGELILGSSIEIPLVSDDIDGDGKIEMVFTTGIPNHGVDYGGLNDANGYLIVVKMGLTPVLAWSDEVHVPRTSFIGHVGPFASTREKSLLIFARGNRDTRVENSSLRVYNLDASFGKTSYYEIPSFGNSVSSTSADLDGDGLLEFYSIDENGGLSQWVDLRKVTTKMLGSNKRFVYALDDLNENGSNELLISAPGFGFSILDGKMNAMAVSNLEVFPTVWHTTAGNRLTAPDGSVFRLTPNPLYLWFRYRDELLIAIFLVLVCLGSLIAYRRGQSESEREVQSSAKDAALSAIESLFVDSGATGRQAIFVLNEKYHDPSFGVEDWACAIGDCSTRTLQRLIKKLTGKTPEHILWARRITEAEALLRDADTEYSISEVAFKVGFKEPSHFTRKYRELRGRAPSDDRNGKVV